MYRVAPIITKTYYHQNLLSSARAPAFSAPFQIQKTSKCFSIALAFLRVGFLVPCTSQPVIYGTVPDLRLLHLHTGAYFVVVLGGAV